MMTDHYVYHERQESSLCGQHALNTLLQGPYFTAPDLADIAAQIDAKEKELMLSHGTDTEDAIKFLAEDSGNINDSGFFSIEVLRTAVERFGDLKLVSAESSEVETHDLDRERAFICNRQEHWFTVRRIESTWYNLNSLSQRPEVISSFFLSAFLAQLRHDGYSVFVVRGTGLPLHGFPDGEGGPGKWYHASELSRAPGKAARAGEGATDDPSKKAKKEASGEDYWAQLGSGNQLGGGGGQRLGGDGSPGDKKPSSISGGRTVGGGTPGAASSTAYDEDEELACAIAMSMADK